DQNPVARAHAAAVGIEQADVDVAANPRDLDLGQAALVVNQLHDLPRDGETHETEAPSLSGCSAFSPAHNSRASTKPRLFYHGSGRSVTRGNQGYPDGK